MTIAELFASAGASYVAPAQNEAQRFLDTAAALLQSKTSPPHANTYECQTKSEPRPIEKDSLRDHIFSLRLKGFDFNSLSEPVGAEAEDGSIVIWAKIGELQFRGPLPLATTNKRYEWLGRAEKLIILPTGEVIIEHSQGVFGSALDGASRKILLAMEEGPGYTVVRNIEQSQQPISLFAKSFFEHCGRIYQSIGPSEIKIGFDTVYGVYETESFPAPTNALVLDSVYENVTSIDRRPQLGTTRIESQHGANQQVDNVMPLGVG